jgi:hypothetical protein
MAHVPGAEIFGYSIHTYIDITRYAHGGQCPTHPTAETKLSNMTKKEKPQKDASKCIEPGILFVLLSL